ncbi:MAG: ABC transporter permease [Oscillospiraceae bacterium]
MIEKLKRVVKTSGFMNFISSVCAIVVGLLFGLIILLCTNPAQAFPAFLTILKGGFTGASGMGQVIYYAVPIIMTGLSVGFAFKTGLFNIGASGQFIVGAFAAVFVAIKFTALGPFTWVVAVLVAIIAGGIWGIVPGLLKAYANVNEVISSIMMNYIGMYLVNFLVRTFIFDQLRNQSIQVPSESNIPRLGLDKLFDNSSMNGGIFIAIIVVVVIYIVLNKTIFGYELKACGQNSEASKYAGINSKRNIIMSMIISGALSGLGGALLYLAGAGKNIQVLDLLAVEGFNGIPVALLGLSNPIGVLFSGMFIAHITVGGINLQNFDFVPEIIDIIVASIIYFSAFSLLFKSVITVVLKRNATKKQEKVSVTLEQATISSDEAPKEEQGGNL